MSLRFVSDGTIAILMSMLFFVIPSELPSFGGCCYNRGGEMSGFNHTDHIYKGKRNTYCIALMMFLRPKFQVLRAQDGMALYTNYCSMFHVLSQVSWRRLPKLC